MKITGNTILVTGGTSGIGRALAEALHAKGNKVIVTGRRRQLLEEIKAKNPGMEALELDAMDKSSVENLAKQVRERFPQLNVLINNAGIAKREDYTADTFDLSIAESTIQTNILSVIQLSAALLPTLKAQGESTLMVTTSGLAFVGFPPGPTYSATKAFLHNWMDALRVQLRNTGVEVLELAPPYVQTELGGSQQASDPHAMPLADYTAEVMQILEEGKVENNEILVERVKPMRWAERDGRYQQTIDAMANM